MALRIAMSLSFLFCNLACGQPELGALDSDPEPPAALAFGLWDDPPPPAPCASLLEAAERAELPLTAEALHDARAQRAGLLDDEFRLEPLESLRAHPDRAHCFAEAACGRVLQARPRAHLVADAIRHAAALLSEPVDVSPLASTTDAALFEAALVALCDAAGGCSEPTGRIPDELQAVMAPLLLAIRAGLLARDERDRAQLDGGRGADWWCEQTGNGLIFDPTGEGYDPAYGPDRRYLASGRRGVYGAAAQIAHAVESIDWRALAVDAELEIQTGAGVIRVGGRGNDVYDTSEPTLLLVDLGGDDVHRDRAASNLSGANAVSILIDVSGDDDYGYEIADDDLRYEGDETFGPISLSTAFRQGAARNGIAMLFDLDGDDRYRSLRGSQGYAHQGVGVLFDRSGDDEYVAEAVSQGAAQFGIGLLIDLSGDDRYASTYASQGFGFVGGVGLAYDRSGDDEWYCDPGDRGPRLFESPQLPGKANTSLCQGAGLGMRGDDPTIAMSGGLGLLRDGGGDDRYTAAVYAQGSGYWQGIGVLSEAGGDDRYDALYYAQGSGVHYAVGILTDDDGDDVRGAGRTPRNLGMGAGYDYGVGVLVDRSGNDTSFVRGLSAGAAAGDGRGLFVDLAGDDAYRGAHPGRADGGVGLMVDRGGEDIYAGE